MALLDIFRRSANRNAILDKLEIRGRIEDGIRRAASERSVWKVSVLNEMREAARRLPTQLSVQQLGVIREVGDVAIMINDPVDAVLGDMGRLLKRAYDGLEDYAARLLRRVLDETPVDEGELLRSTSAAIEHVLGPALAAFDIGIPEEDLPDNVRRVMDAFGRVDLGVEVGRIGLSTAEAIRRDDLELQRLIQEIERLANAVDIIIEAEHARPVIAQTGYLARAMNRSVEDVRDLIVQSMSVDPGDVFAGDRLTTSGMALFLPKLQALPTDPTAGGLGPDVFAALDDIAERS